MKGCDVGGGGAVVSSGGEGSLVGSCEWCVVVGNDVRGERVDSRSSSANVMSSSSATP